MKPEHPSDDNDELGGESMAIREERIHQLARQMSQLSRTNTHNPNVNPFIDASADPRLDPSSGKFSAQFWMKHLVGLARRDPERYINRTAGVTFRYISRSYEWYLYSPRIQKSVCSRIWYPH